MKINLKQLRKINRRIRRAPWEELEKVLNSAIFLIDDYKLSPDGIKDIELLKAKLLAQMREDLKNC